jgi:hypothetical protein
MQAIMDGYLCLLHLTTGVVIENVFIPFATAAFFTFVLVSIFGMRYLLVVWRIQRPESIRASQPPSPTPDQQTPDTSNLLPVANVRRPNPEEPSNPQRDITYLYYRLCKSTQLLQVTNELTQRIRCRSFAWTVFILPIGYSICFCAKYHCMHAWLLVLFILDTPNRT